jgi:hypothetical protein
VTESVNRQGNVAVIYKISFLAFTLQYIAISLGYFTEFRAALTVVICMENLLKNTLGLFIFHTTFATVHNL